MAFVMWSHVLSVPMLLNFYHEWRLSFIQGFFLHLNRGDLTVFSFPFVNVV